MNDFEEGIGNRRRILGDAWVEKSFGEATSLNAELQTLITRHAWHDVWSRNHPTALDDKTRRLLVLAMTLGLGRYEEFALHTKAGLLASDASRLSVDDVRELLIQGAVYCGVPAANTGMHVVANVLKEIDQTAPKLNVVVHGKVSQSRETIVFSHALGYDTTMWNECIAAFKDRYTVIAYDHRGQGKSARVNAAFSMDTLVDDAAAVILNHVFANGGGPVHFAGLSMGGMVAQGLAARYPHLVKSIVVANSAMVYDDTAKALWRARIDTVRRKGMLSVVEMALARWFGAAFRAANPQVVADVTAILLANEAESYAKTCAAIADIDFSRSNPQIQCATTVIGGTADEATQFALSEAIAASIPGAKLAAIDAAHISAVEKPNAFVALLEAHFSKVA